MSEIPARLGHSSIATTGIYLKTMGGSTNPYAAKLASSFGIVEEE